MQYFKTSEVAKAVGLHPNTIRLYEEWGLLPSVSRTPAGYRLFTRDHIDHVKLIRLVLQCSFFGKTIKKTAYQIIHLSAEAKYDEALQCAHRLDEMIRKEHSQAEQAEKILEKWAINKKGENTACSKASLYEASAESPDNQPLCTEEAISSRAAAEILEITVDILRDWERNNLIRIPRNSENGYRVIGPAEINKLRVIRALRRSRYSNMAILRAMQKLESGSTDGLREALDSPELDEDRGYLCFTDNLLTALKAAMEAMQQIIGHLQTKVSQA